MQRIKLKPAPGEKLKLIIRGTCKDYATLSYILTLCALHFGVSVEDIKGKCRKTLLIKARHSAAYLAKQHTKLNLKSIGQQLGGRDHTTVIHAIKCVRASIKNQDSHVFPHIEGLEQQVKEFATPSPVLPAPAPVFDPFPPVTTGTSDYLTTVCLS